MGHLNLQTKENVQQYAPIRGFYLFLPNIQFELHIKRNTRIVATL
jgi:hypothetical protein